MMMKLNQKIALFVFAAIALPAMLACNGPKDNTIKADLSVKAVAEKDFEGVWFTVENGVVTLSGECPTDKSKSAVEKKATNLYGVKKVINHITIAPVTIGTDRLLKQGVDSILQQYATVAAITRDSVVYLKGNLPNDKLPALTSAINTLKPKTIRNELGVQ